MSVNFTDLFHDVAADSLLDPLHHRPYTYNRTAKDFCILRKTAEMERHSRILGRHNSHPSTVAVDRICSGAVRHLRVVR